MDASAAAERSDRVALIGHPGTSPSSRGPRALLRSMPSWLLSALAHGALLLLLALLTLHAPTQERATLLLSATDSEEVLPETALLSDATSTDDLVDLGAAASASESLSPAAPSLLELPEVVAPSALAPTSLGPESIDLLAPAGGGAGSLLVGRTGAVRADLLRRRGGGAGTEAAVEAALAWIVAHQHADGGWDLDHASIGCDCRGDPASLAPSRNAATALGLLPLLGAGQTHLEGKYRANVERGLEFLVRNMQPELGGGSLRDAGAKMYSHGLAATALCEAYAMTRDSRYRDPAAASLAYIIAAQDVRGGGWRYNPGASGDVSVTGCLLIALKSGQMGLLDVPATPFRRSGDFLKSAQVDGGAQYRYMPGRRVGPGPSAIGLLSRMYLGWERDRPAIRKGVRLLSRVGPSQEDMYFNFYASMVLSHFGGELWTDWNDKMKAILTATQAQKGHEAGSWYFDHHFIGQPGGRLASTSLAALTLEIYYRYLPLYSSTGDAFEQFPD